ncbi:50S ribosomal protein L15 [Candidatus Woesearchaeota archaeon]|nr:50S ribosomal protein L15 [Candidatus Woesearchaeota archaeon]
MTVNRRKKDVKFRGSHTHGWGSKKKHRGSGNRGGKGNAGTGKRADQNKPSIWHEQYFGKHGFTHKGAVRHKSVNIEFLDQNIEKLVKSGVAKQQNGAFAVNIADLGFGKLLGKGRVTRKMAITAGYASSRAVDAVREAGGEVIVANQKATASEKAAVAVVAKTKQSK